MYYLLVVYTYTTSDFQGDNNRGNKDYLLYFCSTYKECEVRYESVKDDLLKKYNVAGHQTYGRHEDYFFTLDEYDINCTIDLVQS